MTRILALLCLVTALALPEPAPAQSVRDRVVSQLEAQGFGNFRISRTLLGRVRIVAIGRGMQREIVFNPATGEILRDLSRPIRKGVQGSNGHASGASNDRNGGGGGDDDDDDDDDDDGDDDHDGGDDDDD
ncbi:hypothetical protein [Vannielia litorea]|uniref:hypothetical protein n=1 Tax=Vannielia litorea TaxID=1217970 RepID=UPI001C96E7B5|nr:hypothetical protein [Vannielia litorea]MBY6048881.1 hypothetical protein [Vannielia litorea]MBY6076295.1 hypothetical protein [Vannielia litorea]